MGVGEGETKIKGKREKTIAAMQILYITIKSENKIILLVETSKCCL